MKTGLNFFGAGPKIGRIALPWLVITIVLTLLYGDIFAFTTGTGKTLLIIGAAVVFCGLTMYILTVPKLMKGLKETRLVTTGTFALCCNPLYASIILLIIPGVSLMMNSWLVLTTSLVAYITFKRAIRSEYEEMTKFFGEEYIKYRQATPEFFPLPLKRWLGGN